MMLSSNNGSVKTPLLKTNEDKMYIYESGMYKLIFRSKKNKLRHSLNGFVQRFYHPSGNMDLTSQKKRP